MAAVTVTFDGVRVDDAENAGTWASLTSGGAGPQNEGDFFLQGTQAVSRKVGTAIGGLSFDYSGTGSVDMTAADRKLWMAKIQATNKDKLLTNGSPSMEVWFGSSSSDYYIYDIYGSDDYPRKGGWVVFPINPNVAAHRSGSAGTPVLTAVDWFGLRCDFSGTSKSENVVMDAIDVGVGLCLVGGDSTDPDGTIDDFLADDDGEATTGRYGYFLLEDDIYKVRGMHWIGRNDSGTTVVTEFTDSDKTLVFPAALYDAGDAGFSLDTGNVGTAINFTNYDFLGVGSKAWKLFDVRTEANGGNIDNTTDEIRFPDIHRFVTGDYVDYSNEVWATSIGLTDGNDYWVRVVNETDITLHTGSRRDAFANTNRVTLTGAAASVYEYHALRTITDGRACLKYGSTFTGSASFTSSKFLNFCPGTIPPNTTYEKCIFDGVGQVTIDSATALISDCLFRNPAGEISEAYIQTADTTGIVNTEFDAGAGDTWKIAHAIELTAAGTFPFDGNLFTGYGDRGTFTFDTELGVDADGTDWITFAGRATALTDRAYWYEKGTGTESIGLNDGQLYYLEAKSTKAVTVHLTKEERDADINPISLTPSGAGNGETHTFYRNDHPVWNNSGGLVTLELTSGTNLSWGATGVRNSGASTTSVIALGTISLQLFLPENDLIPDQANDPAMGASVRIEDFETGAVIAEGAAVQPSQPGKGASFFDQAFNAVSFGDVARVKIRYNSFGSRRYLPINQALTLVQGQGSASIYLTRDTTSGKGNVDETGIIKLGFRSQSVFGLSSTLWDAYPNMQLGMINNLELPSGKDRKLVAILTLRSLGTDVFSAGTMTYDGNAMTQVVLGEFTDTDPNYPAHLISVMYYYDIPDSDAGEKTIVMLESVASNNSRIQRGLHVAVLGDMASGAAEDSASVTGDLTATDPSLTLNNTTADAVDLMLVFTNALDIPVATGVGNIYRTEPHRIFSGSTTSLGPPGSAILEARIRPHQLTAVTEERTSSGSHSLGANYTEASQTYVAIGATFARK